MVRDIFCFCGKKQLGNKQCSDGRHCPRQEKGHGHWHVALPFLQNMPTAQRNRRYPGLRLGDLARHVEEQGQKKRDRKRERHPHASGSAGHGTATRRIWRSRSNSKNRQSERHPQASGSSSSRPPEPSDAEKRAVKLREQCVALQQRLHPTFLEHQPEAKQMP